MEGKMVPSGMDSRVTMLANAINRAAENISATSLWAKPIDKIKTQLQKNSRSPNKLASHMESPSTSTSPRYPNPIIKSSPERAEHGARSTQSTSTTTVNNALFSDHIQDEAPWEDFRAGPQLLPTAHQATPPPRRRENFQAQPRLKATHPIPPPLPIVTNTAATSTTTALEHPETSEPLSGNGADDELPDNSIGTQTDKATLLTSSTKSKAPKMKTKSLQIDFPSSGILKTRTIFSRARSLTPTRYKVLKDDAKPQSTDEQKTNKPAPQEKKEEVSGKSSAREKGSKRKREKVRRAQSLSPVNNRRKRQGKSHQPRERIIKARSQTQLKEIVPSASKPKTVIVWETETKEKKMNTENKKTDKGKERKNKVEKAKTSEKKPAVKVKETKIDKLDTAKNLKLKSDGTKDDKSESDSKNNDPPADKKKEMKGSGKKREKGNSKKTEKIVKVKKDKLNKDELNSKDPNKTSEQNKGEVEETKKANNGHKDDNKDAHFPGKGEIPGEDSVLTTMEEKEDKSSEKQKDQRANDFKVPSNNPNGDAVPTNISTTVADETIPELDETHETPDTKGKAENESNNDVNKNADAITPAPEVKAEKKKENMITEEDNAHREVDLGNDKPPGDENLDEMEELMGQLGDEGLQEELDPEMVKRTEEQIFAKIKFYKDVISHVRQKPWTLRKKMTLLKEAKDYTARFEGRLSTGGGPGQIARFKVAWAKASRAFSNYTALLVPWNGRIRHIESYFGSAVASYFTFLRWIFWTNIIQACIMGFVITMPEIMFGPDWGTVEYKAIPVNETVGASYLKTAWDFEGYLKYSPLFYGYYSSIKKFDSGYRMPLAYLIANLATFAYSFIAILRQIAANAKDEKASDKDDNFTFSWKAFASWDYMIGNAETAKNKFKSILLAIRESITELKEAKKKISKKLKAIRVFTNFGVIAILASSTYAIYLTVNRSKEFEERIKKQGPDSVNAWERNEISIVMSAVTSFFPILFEVIGGVEDYHPRIALKWALFRIMVLYLLNLYTLYIALYWKIMDIQKGVADANSTYYEAFNLTANVICSQQTTLPPPTTLFPLNSTAELSSNLRIINSSTTCIPDFIPETTCWETMVGQELFKLTVFDLVTTVGVIYASEFFRALFIKYLNACWCWDLEKHLPGYATFSLAENLLHLVYNQGMIWMGTLFSPGLPAFNLIKLLVMFYVRAWAVMVCNVPEERIFKVGSENFYLLLLLFMLYVVMIPIAFAMVSIAPSPNCGPFREVQYMYLALTEWLQEVFSPTVYSIISYTSSPGALIPIFILLFLILNYLKSTNDALKGAVLDLKKQLNYERKEGKKKVFSMADGSKSTGKNTSAGAERKSVPGGAGMTALRALSKMGAFSNRARHAGTESPRSMSAVSLHSNPDMGERQPQPNNSMTLGGVMAATQFVARMRQRAGRRAGVKLNPPPPGLNV